jgi:hypothetical protein
MIAGNLLSVEKKQFFDTTREIFHSLAQGPETALPFLALTTLMLLKGATGVIMKLKFDSSSYDQFSVLHA